MGFICLKAAGPLRGDCLLFTDKTQKTPETHLIDLGKMKGWALEPPPSGFEPGII